MSHAIVLASLEYSRLQSVVSQCEQIRIQRFFTFYQSNYPPQMIADHPSNEQESLHQSNALQSMHPSDAPIECDVSDAPIACTDIDAPIARAYLDVPIERARVDAPIECFQVEHGIEHDKAQPCRSRSESQGSDSPTAHRATLVSWQQSARWCSVAS